MSDIHKMEILLVPLGVVRGRLALIEGMSDVRLLLPNN